MSPAGKKREYPGLDLATPNISSRSVFFFHVVPMSWPFGVFCGSLLSSFCERLQEHKGNYCVAQILVVVRSRKEKEYIEPAIHLDSQLELKYAEPIPKGPPRRRISVFQGRPKIKRRCGKR